MYEQSWNKWNGFFLLPADGKHGYCRPKTSISGHCPNVRESFATLSANNNSERFTGRWNQRKKGMEKLKEFKTESKINVDTTGDGLNWGWDGYPSYPVGRILAVSPGYAADTQRVRRINHRSRSIEVWRNADAKNYKRTNDESNPYESVLPPPRMPSR